MNMPAREQHSLVPAFGGQAAAVVLAADENYVPYLGVTLASLIEHSRPEHDYDLIVLETGVSADSKVRLAGLIAGRPNFSLRFLDMAPSLDKLSAALYVGRNDYVSPATYYRLFITSICERFAKIVYLDCDLIIQADVAELFQADLAGRPLGAVTDFFAVKDLAGDTRANRRWAAGLELRDYRGYFNAGVLVFDLARLRTLGFEGRCLERLRRVVRPKLHDQDILNHVCQGLVTYLDPAWNSQAWVEAVTWEHLKGAASDEAFGAFTAAGRAPKIIHYLTQRKPWFTPGPALARPFWRCAARTPFLHDILLRHLGRRNEECELLKMAVRYPHRRLTLVFYRLMSVLAFGERRRLYRKKADRLRQINAAIKKMIRL